MGLKRRMVAIVVEENHDRSARREWWLLVGNRLDEGLERPFTMVLAYCWVAVRSASD